MKYTRKPLVQYWMDVKEKKQKTPGMCEKLCSRWGERGCFMQEGVEKKTEQRRWVEMAGMLIKGSWDWDGGKVIDGLSQNRVWLLGEWPKMEVVQVEPSLDIYQYHDQISIITCHGQNMLSWMDHNPPSCSRSALVCSWTLRHVTTIHGQKNHGKRNGDTTQKAYCGCWMLISSDFVCA